MSVNQGTFSRILRNKIVVFIISLKYLWDAQGTEKNRIT